MGIYLNNAATTWPKPACVPQAMAEFLVRGGANLARGSASERDLGTLDRVSHCRETLAAFFDGHRNADPRYVTFAANVTEALNIVLKGFLEPDMRVLSTSMEHNAVVRPLRGLEKRGVRVEFLACSREGRLDPATLSEALASPVDLVVLSHASNVCGTIQDIDAIAELCAKRQIPLVLDAAQTAGVLPLSVRRWNLAALCFTGHKGLLGPQGIGGIVWHPDFASRTRPLIEGGTGSFSHDEHQPETMPDKFEAGTPNLPGIAGLLAAVEWIGNEGRENIRLREEKLGALLLEGILSLPEVRFSGPSSMSSRLPVFAFNIDGKDNGILAMRLSDEFGVETRPGLHCAPLAHRTLGSFPEGALRISPGFFSTEDEIDLCIDALRTITAQEN